MDVLSQNGSSYRAARSDPGKQGKGGDRNQALGRRAGSSGGSSHWRSSTWEPGMTATGPPRHEGRTGWLGLALPSVTLYKSRLRDIPHYSSICMMNWELTFANGADTRQRWCLQMMQDLSSDIGRCWGSFQQREGGDDRATSVNCNWFRAHLQFAIWAKYNWAELSWTKLSWVEWCGVSAIVWNQMKCSRGRIFDLDFDWMVPWHIDSAMTEYCVMIYDMSPHGLWGLRRRVTGPWTLWRSAKITSRELTELHEMSRNAAPMGAFKHELIELPGTRWIVQQM